MATAERALGRAPFDASVGHFWSTAETRPYPRAHFGLAHACWALGQRPDAIEHLREMPRLNPNDEQGVRHVLLNWRLEIGDDAEAGTPLDAYPDDAAAVWHHGRTVHAFRLTATASSVSGTWRRVSVLNHRARRWNTSAELSLTLRTACSVPICSIADFRATKSRRSAGWGAN